MLKPEHMQKHKFNLTKKRGYAQARAGFLFFLVTLIVLVMDQGSKHWVVNHFQPGESVPLLGQFVFLTYVRNPGAAFGLFAYKTHFFIIISIIMIILTVIAAYQIPPNLAKLRFGLAIMLGGVAGNLFDRLQSGYVVDFIDLRFWPVFNIADMGIVVGVLMLAIGLSLSTGKSVPKGPGQGGD